MRVDLPSRQTLNNGWKHPPPACILYHNKTGGLKISNTPAPGCDYRYDLWSKANFNKL